VRQRLVAHEGRVDSAEDNGLFGSVTPNPVSQGVASGRRWRHDADADDISRTDVVICLLVILKGA
jgi:hypothetical protein